MGDLCVLSINIDFDIIPTCGHYCMFAEERMLNVNKKNVEKISFLFEQSKEWNHLLCIEPLLNIF